jgi:signal transduction histidine kinase
MLESGPVGIMEITGMNVVESEQQQDGPSPQSSLEHTLASPQPPPEEPQAAQWQRRISELEDALRHREHQIEAMQKTSAALLSHSTVDAMVKETLTLAIAVLNADAGSLLLHNSVSDTLVFRYVIGPASSSLIGFAMPAAEGIAGRVFRTGTPDITHRVSESQEFNHTVDEKTGYHTESMMTVPVKRAEGQPIGVMQVLNASGAFDERDCEVLQVMAAQAAAAIENARLAQEARKAEIVNLIGDISHDIKNMLTPIQSGVWTLQPMLDEMFEALDAIHAQCPQSDAWGARIKEAAALAREDYGWILNAALDAAEKVQVRTKEIADAIKGESALPLFEDANLNEIVQEVVRSLRTVAFDRRINLKPELDANLPLAQFDRKQMYNALYNLVNNAIPETPPHGSIIIRTRAPQADQSTLSLEVQDTGKGIPEHVRIRLFTDEAVSIKPGGTGLGTRIVAGVIRRHHGTISVQSELGKGTIFTIRLPLRHHS